MFPNVAFLATASMAILAAVAPVSAHSARSPAQSCSGGAVQCCNSVQQSNAGSAAFLKALLSLDVGEVTGLIGLTCSPVTAIGLGGTSCSQQTVCCSNNSFNGVVALGCTPININA